MLLQSLSQRKVGKKSAMILYISPRTRWNVAKKNKNNSVKYEWYELLSTDSSDNYVWKSIIDRHAVL